VDGKTCKRSEPWMDGESGSGICHRPRSLPDW
jgi:hypothetical protein